MSQLPLEIQKLIDGLPPESVEKIKNNVISVLHANGQELQFPIEISSPSDPRHFLGMLGEEKSYEDSDQKPILNWRKALASFNKRTISLSNLKASLLGQNLPWWMLAKHAYSNHFSEVFKVFSVMVLYTFILFLFFPPVLIAIGIFIQVFSFILLTLRWSNSIFRKTKSLYKDSIFQTNGYLIKMNFESTAKFNLLSSDGIHLHRLFGKEAYVPNMPMQDSKETVEWVMRMAEKNPKIKDYILNKVNKKQKLTIDDYFILRGVNEFHQQ